MLIVQADGLTIVKDKEIRCLQRGQNPNAEEEHQPEYISEDQQTPAGQRYQTEHFSTEGRTGEKEEIAKLLRIRHGHGAAAEINS